MLLYVRADIITHLCEKHTSDKDEKSVFVMSVMDKQL